jgi:hypothetical protein
MPYLACAAAGAVTSQPADLLLRLFGEVDERTGGRAVAGNIGAVDPRTAGVAFEVVTRPRAEVARGEIESVFADRRAGGDHDLAIVLGVECVLRVGGRCDRGSKRERGSGGNDGFGKDHRKLSPGAHGRAAARA